MARITVTLNGRSYPIACDDGQENRVRHLVAQIETRMSELKRAAGSASETHLLVMLCLLLADELEELRNRVRSGQPLPAPSAGEDPMLANIVGQLASHVEAIAARLRQA